MYDEIFQRFADATRVAYTGRLVALVLVAAIAFALWPRNLVARRLGPLGSRIVFAVCATAATAGACSYAWSFRWLSDDAYISFRYARNLAAGHGLVFNPGERVEGYTNFLWTVLIAAAIRLGFDAGQTALVLGMASFAGALVVSQVLARRMTRTLHPVAVPVTMLLLGLNYTFASYATSGLETMFATLAMIAAVERADADAPLAAGLLAVTAVLAHPDHAILCVALGAVLLVDRGRRRTVPRYAAPFLLIYLPYFVWRYHYYADFFPNTYYAKSGGDWYFSQGGVYLVICTLAAGYWGVLPLMLFGAWSARRTVLARYTLVGVPLYLVYVAKVGGDFMLGRLLCAVLPPVAILAEVGLRTALARRWPWRVGFAVALALASAAVVPLDLVHPGEKFAQVADERTFYEVRSFSPIEISSPSSSIASALNNHFVRRRVTPIVALGCVGIIGYDTGLPIIDTYGLTDRFVAHTPIAERGRPGHEKSTSPGYLLSRNADIWDRSFYPEPYGHQTRLMLDGNEFFLSAYFPDLVADLRATGVSPAVNVPQEIEAYVRDDHPKPLDEVACDLWFFSDYYFRVNHDPALQSKLMEHMTAVGAIPPRSEPFFDYPRDRPPPGYVAVRKFEFERQDPAFFTDGTAFATWPTSTPIVGQGVPGGVTNKYIDTSIPGLGDVATGFLRSPSFVIDGDFVTVQLGGGRDLQRLLFNLTIDGAVVGSVTGCDTELTSRRIFDVSGFRGKTAQFTITDASPLGWGHLIVDDVVVWDRR